MRAALRRQWGSVTMEFPLLRLAEDGSMFNALYFRTFITLVETGSFTRTAEHLEMTQPGVSQHVRKLEQYLDKSLLDRQGRRFTLTEAGKRAYDYALDRKSTRLNSSHVRISYAVFCLKKK